MKVSAKTEYACLAMLELAARYGTGEPVRILTFDTGLDEADMVVQRIRDLELPVIAAEEHH